jgi:hypothetical protein
MGSVVHAKKSKTKTRRPPLTTQTAAAMALVAGTMTPEVGAKTGVGVKTEVEMMMETARGYQLSQAFLAEEGQEMVEQGGAAKAAAEAAAFPGEVGEAVVFPGEVEEAAVFPGEVVCLSRLSPSSQ